MLNGAVPGFGFRAELLWYLSKFGERVPAKIRPAVVSTIGRTERSNNLTPIPSSSPAMICDTADWGHAQKPWRFASFRLVQRLQ